VANLDKKAGCAIEENGWVMDVWMGKAVLVGAKERLEVRNLA